MNKVQDLDMLPNMDFFVKCVEAGRNILFCYPSLSEKVKLFLLQNIYTYFKKAFNFSM